MINRFRIIVICLILTFCYNFSFGQDSTTIDFFSKIKSYNLSKVLMADSIWGGVGDNNMEMIKRDEMLGFIGDDYQRFYIHFISMVKDPTNPYLYVVSGKTRVKNNICSFKGTIIIKQSRLYKNTDCAKCKQGFVDCNVILNEDKKQEASGTIKGKLRCNFWIEKKHGFGYDATNMVSDGFANNQFTGTWTSYKANVSKKCNWGDYRIPESKALDIGVGDFSINDKYLKNGWENYKLANSDSDKPEVKRAKEKELEKWWK